jgi:putative transposase
VIALANLLVQLLGDLVVLGFLAARPTRSLAAENLLLRRQLALYLERGTKPSRIDAATRITLAWLSRLCDWRSALVVVRPQTVIRWHRAGWRLLWRYKSRPGRPPIPHELRHLIRRIANENPLWVEERIANELLVSSVSGSRHEPSGNTCPSDLRVAHAVISAGRPFSGTTHKRLSLATSLPR